MVKTKHVVTLLFGVMMLPLSFAETSVASTSGEDSFAQIEALDRHMEQAGKEIDALKVTQQLKELQDKANKMSMDFVVLRIFGIDHQLTAVMQFDNKAVMSYKTGDLIENKFKITAIMPNAVHVYDLTNKVARVVPFA